MSINIVWFKRDLRLTDHEPLAMAIKNQKPLLLITFFEPSLMDAPQSDVRHWRFVHESIQDINKTLSPYGHQINVFHEEVAPTLSRLFSQLDVDQLFSYQESGLSIIYDRDKAVKKLCAEHNVTWKEYQYAGVIRGLQNRSNWSKKWYTQMGKPQFDIDLKALQNIKSVDCPVKTGSLPDAIVTPDERFLKGGPSMARRYLNSFLKDRSVNYNKHISKPELSRKSCSRLSPYLAWGNLSMREVYQAMQKAKPTHSNKRALSSFGSRLRWHCHFIQKFEMEMRYENENINRGYDAIRDKWDEKKFDAWKTGNTGYPLVDACMRCVNTTGYLNFRMRAMVVSFLTHHLWLHWKKGADYLAKQFLDFEPGIHYPQFQMQAGTTGINTIRIYNPVKQAKDNDAEGDFVKKWVPELSELPIKFIIEPWLMTEAEQQMYGIRLGKDYPRPIVDIKTTYKEASSALYKMKGDKKVRAEASRILKKHTTANRRV